MRRRLLPRRRGTSRRDGDVRTGGETLFVWTKGPYDAKSVFRLLRHEPWRGGDHLKCQCEQCGGRTNSKSRDIHIAADNSPELASHSPGSKTCPQGEITVHPSYGQPREWF